ncbi:MAG: DUF2878 domain-containing protein [Pseudomonadales bacterium]
MSHGNLINGVLFQAAWFACVLGGAQGSNLWGAAAVASLIVFALLGRTRDHDLVLGCVAACIGFVIDTVWIRTGILDYAGAGIAPLWIVMLWVGVGLSINHSLSMFKARPWLGGLLAGASAPLSYLAGERFGAVTIADPWHLALVSLVWAPLFAAVFALSRVESQPNLRRRSDFERAH